MWNCENCESSNKDGDNVCRICNHPKPQEVKVALSREPVTANTPKESNDNKSCFGIGVSSVIIILCVLLLIGNAIVSAISSNGQGPAPTKTIKSIIYDPVNVNPSSTPRNTVTQSKNTTPTKTPKGSEFANYSCPDKSQIKLNIGLRAFVSFDYVNLRSSPVVPDVWDANIVATLQKGDRMTIVGGPKCAYDGTWWEVQTDNGYTGWVRELQPNKILLEPIR